MGHPEPRVAQHGAHQVIGQKFGPVRAQRDRRLPARPADDVVRLVGTLGI